MGKDLIIAANRHETKVAILEDEQLVEMYFQRANEYSLVGSIHKGRVTRVLPGMQSAFVDIGLERDAFLYVSDFFEESEEYEQLAGDDKGRGATSGTETERPRGRGRDRGRGRGRGRGRDRDRDRDRTVEAEQKPVQASPEPSREKEPEERRDETESEGRDRSGRRSRRRRSKGRGFPESKYAAAPAGERGERMERDRSAPAAEESEPESREEPQHEILLLPGESLAKYRKPASEPVVEETEPIVEEDTYEEELESAVDEEVEVTDEDEADVDEDSGEEVGEEEESESDSEEEDDEDEDVEEEPEEDSEDEKESEEEEPDEEGSHEEESEEEAREEEESDDEEAPSEDSETQDVTLDRPEDSETTQEDEGAAEEVDAESESAEEDEEESEQQPAAETTEEEDEKPRRSANVREKDSRYLQRGSRRGRRRGRGGNTRSDSKEQDSNGGDRKGGEPSTDASADTGGRTGGRSGGGRREPRSERPPLPLISDLLKEGQEILVQIAKEPLGQKGARITSHIALPGRYVVYMPTLDHLGVSRKIGSDDERARLRRILQSNSEGISGGFIMRTAGEGKSEKEIAADMNNLGKLWADIRQTADKKRAPALLHHDLRVVERILRDQVSDDFSTVWVDGEEAYEEVLRFMQRFQPTLVNRVRMYTRSAPIFDAFNITQELEKALRPKVWLKSGGYIVINQTEALLAIDINTGKYVGKSNRLEDTIVRTNVEAVKEIARQMRLRDLGGIIVVDFIDMDERKNRQKVMQTLEEAMRLDRAPNKILQFNDFGLVAITRKRVKQSLERTLCMPCPYCEGAAYVKSVDTIIGEILTEAYKLAPAIDGGDVMLRVNPDVAKTLKNSENEYLQELEEILGCPVLIAADQTLHHEKFDLA
jgi:Rne/Rng family ribonuclease